MRCSITFGSCTGKNKKLSSLQKAYLEYNFKLNGDYW